MGYTRQQIYQMEDQVEQVVARLDSYNYYQLLGVDPQAAREVVEFTYNTRVAEYTGIRGLKICSAALYQHLGKLLERLEEAHRVLLDDQARAEYHQWLAAGHTRHFGQAAVKPREVEQKDEYLEAAARQLQRRIGDGYIHAAEEELEDRRTWSIELGEGETVEGEDLEQVEQHLRDDLVRLGVHDEVGEEDVAASLDAEFLAQTGAGLRKELDEFGVVDEVGEEDASATLDVAYLEQAEAHLRQQLQRSGVRDEAPLDDQSASLDMAYLEEAAEHLEAQLAGAKPVAAPRKPATARERGLELRREAVRGALEGKRPAASRPLRAAPAGRPVVPRAPRVPAAPPARPPTAPAVQTATPSPASPRTTGPEQPRVSRSPVRPPAAAAADDDDVVLDVIPLDDE